MPLDARAPAPLHGVRVLELGQFVAAPAASLILADLGADVVKIEPPAGEPVRASQDAATFWAFNRNKASLGIDLKQPAGVDLVLRLVKTADVVIDNYVPGTLERLGLGYEVLSRTNPRVIYCGIRGFLEGPYGHRPLMDEAAQMAAGLAYMTGPLGTPLRAGAPVNDIGAGLWSVLGIVTALLQRASSGTGQPIAVGLFETTVFWLSHSIAKASVTGEVPLPMPNRGMGTQLGVGIYRLFHTRDDRSIFIGVVSDAQWARFCLEFGLHDLWNDLELRTRAARTARGAELEQRVADVVANEDSAVLLERLERCQAAFALLNTPLDLLDDAHLIGRGGLLDVPLPPGEEGTLRVPAMPLVMNGGIDVIATQPPRLGEGSRAVLAQLGLTEVEIVNLVAQHILVPDPGA
jgi:crotonobetainyl-CoA:carnitine CoA-transferase CaiB-like acyl-CoA transferase